MSKTLETIIGIACLKHDLTHSLKCGHCYKQLEEENAKLREALQRPIAPEQYWSEEERDGMYEAYKMADKRGHGMYERLFAVGAFLLDKRKAQALPESPKE